MWRWSETELARYQLEMIDIKRLLKVIRLTIKPNAIMPGNLKTGWTRSKALNISSLYQGVFGIKVRWNLSETGHDQCFFRTRQTTNTKGKINMFLINLSHAHWQTLTRFIRHVVTQNTFCWSRWDQNPDIGSHDDSPLPYYPRTLKEISSVCQACYTFSKDVGLARTW